MKLYSLAEIASEMSVAASTLRYHAQYYQEFLPLREVEGERWPKYEDGAVGIFETIMQMVGDNKSREEIKDHLMATYDTIYDFPNKQEITTSPNRQEPTVPLDELYQYVDDNHDLLRRAMETIRYQREMINVQEQMIADLEARITIYELNQNKA